MKRILDKIDTIKTKQALIKVKEVILNELKKCDSYEAGIIAKEPIEVNVSGKYSEYQKMIGYANRFVMFNRYGTSCSGISQNKK